MTQINLTGKDQYGRSVPLLPEKIINMIVLDNPEGSRTKQLTTIRPGLSTLATMATANCRGMAVNESASELYVVMGNKFYELNTSFTATERGTLSSSTGVVQIKVGLDNVAINPVGGGSTAYYFIPSSNTFSAVVDADYPTLATLDYVDNVFIGNKPADREWQYSDINDFSSWSVNFADAEARADNIVRMIVVNRDVWILKQNNCEIWRNSGDVFTFDPIQWHPYGCVAAMSAVVARNSVYWLGRDDKGGIAIYKTQGYDVTVLSPPGISYKLTSLSTISDAEAYSYVTDDNHVFILWTFPTADLTICYNVTNNTYSEWQNSTSNRFPIRGMAYFNNKIVIGNPSSAVLSLLSKSNVDDAGTDFSFQIITPTIISGRKLIFCHRAEIDFESGGGGSNEITVSKSVDGGNNYTSLGTQAAGTTSTKRMFYSNLGSGYTWTFKITGSSVQDWRFFGLFCEFEVGEY